MPIPAFAAVERRSDFPSVTVLVEEGVVDESVVPTVARVLFFGSIMLSSTAICQYVLLILTVSKETLHTHQEYA